MNATAAGAGTGRRAQRLVQAQLLDPFERLRDEFGLTYLLISHDLGVVKRISDA